MNQFNRLIVNGTAIKRAYGGATTSRLKYYVNAAINIDKPDTIIINGGTNNFTKTNQTPEEISNEIFEIVEMCKRGGLKHIFVSSITCRPSYQLQINEVNKLLEKNAGYYGYDYIDNVNIGETHLRNDGVHLNNQGITILANNFLNNLNRPSVIYPFSSIWD